MKIKHHDLDEISTADLAAISGGADAGWTEADRISGRYKTMTCLDHQSCEALTPAESRAMLDGIKAVGGRDELLKHHLGDGVNGLHNELNGRILMPTWAPRP
jgi:hypothetical protein